MTHLVSYLCTSRPEDLKGDENHRKRAKILLKIQPNSKTKRYLLLISFPLASAKISLSHIKNQENIVIRVQSLKQLHKSSLTIMEN